MRKSGLGKQLVIIAYDLAILAFKMDVDVVFG